MVGLNTTAPKVFWNGKEVADLAAIQVACVVGNQPSVVLKVKEQTDLAEMQAAGVVIRRVA